jgi:hypothetical protein
MHSSPSGILWINDRTSKVIGLGVEDKDHNTAQGEITEPPQELQILATAKTFDDEVAGKPGNKSQTYAAFHKLVIAEKPVPTAVLKALKKKSTAAGRLYIAALIRELDPPAGIVALRELFNDSTKVTYVSGCEGLEYSVGEIAKQLLDNGSFQNFRLRYCCKT